METSISKNVFYQNLIVLWVLIYGHKSRLPKGAQMLHALATCKKGARIHTRISHMMHAQH